MCGLVGVAGQIGRDEEGLFKDLLVMDTIRGYHSTGMAVIDSCRTPEGASLFKLPMAGPEFVRHDMFSKLIPYTSAALIGHNRAATVGAINAHNAHPFQAGNIIGAHNGTLPHAARRQLNNHQDYTTDSEALFHNIHRDGAELVLGSIWGAWALTYWDFEADRLMMIRNDERPLWYAFSKDRSTVVWASEYMMLYAASERHYMDIEQAEEVPVNTLLSFDIPTYMPKGTKLSDPEEVATVVPGKPPAVPQTTRVIPIGGNSTKTNAGKTTDSTEMIILPPDRIANESEPDGEDLRDCAWCTAREPHHEMHTINSFGEPAILCGDCFDDPTIMQYMVFESY